MSENVEGLRKCSSSNCLETRWLERGGDTRDLFINLHSRGVVTLGKIKLNCVRPRMINASVLRIPEKNNVA